MPVFIANHYSGVPESIVLARSRELAVAYWHGKGVIAHTIEEFDEVPEDHPTGVVPLLTTRCVSSAFDPEKFELCKRR